MAAEIQKKTESPAPAASSELTAAITLLAQQLKPQGPLEMSGLSPERIAAITQLPKPQRYRKIPWKSSETGATAIAHVVESRTFPHGRVVALENYTHPPETYIAESLGGRVPDGFSLWNGRPLTLAPGQEPAQGDLNPAFLQWRYETFYRADLRRVIGKAIHAHDCDEAGEGLKTPWAESRVGAPHAAE
jgi:hypothetical protein